MAGSRARFTPIASFTKPPDLLGQNCWRADSSGPSVQSADAEQALDGGLSAASAAGVPDQAIRPRSRMITGSAKSSALWIRCSTSRTVMSPPAPSCDKAAISSSQMTGASPSSGSSSSSTVGRAENGARRRQHLLLAAGQLAAQILAPLLEPRKHLIGLVDRRRGRVLQADEQVFLDGQRGKDAARLRHVAEPGAGARWRSRRWVISVPPRLIAPACRRVWPAMVASSVVLPMPLRPSTARRAAGRHGEADALQHACRAVAGTEIKDVKRRCGHRHSFRDRPRARAHPASRRPACRRR